MRRYTPERIVFLGDSFHDAEGASRMQAADRAALMHLLGNRLVTWVLGNHDPVAPDGLPGETMEELREGPSCSAISGWRARRRASSSAAISTPRPACPPAAAR
ncbi:hypothetical protein ACFQU7_04355 [Pseudoroseomonas wenyumeiae]